jgi:hypothetical protein
MIELLTPFLNWLGGPWVLGALVLLFLSLTCYILFVANARFAPTWCSRLLLPLQLAFTPQRFSAEVNRWMPQAPSSASPATVIAHFHRAARWDNLYAAVYALLFLSGLAYRANLDPQAPLRSFLYLIPPLTAALDWFENYNQGKLLRGIVSLTTPQDFPPAHVLLSTLISIIKLILFYGMLLYLIWLCVSAGIKPPIPLPLD